MEFERLKEIIVDTLACDEDKVTLEADMQKDLEVDSLSLVELHMALEDELGVSIPDGEIGKMHTVKDILDYANNAKAYINQDIKTEKQASLGTLFSKKRIVSKGKVKNHRRKYEITHSKSGRAGERQGLTAKSQ